MPSTRDTLAGFRALAREVSPEPAPEVKDAPMAVAPPSPVIVEVPARAPVGWSIVFARDSDGNISGATVLPMEPAS